MRPVKTWTKDPDAELDYSLDWSEWLDEGDAVATATWVVPDGLEQLDDDLDGAVATVWLGGGTAGENYDVTCRVTTTGGRTDDRSIRLQVAER